MTVVNVALNYINPNPWQTRLAADVEYICELADDIARNGLLQTPVGRYDIDKKHVELAFGHNRLESYNQLLHNQGDKWKTMPVDVRKLSDEQMADFAWAENERRRDVTPMERAKAIQQRMEDFGWTQEQTAEHVGMSRPAVANVLRLLRLPENLQGSVQEGEISERQAMALLPMVELPEEVLRKTGDSYYGNPSDIIKSAKGGESSSDIRERVDYIFERYMKDLSDADWPMDQVFEIENVKAPACDKCDKRIQRGKKMLCPVEACYELKNEAWKRKQLEEASQVVGIQAKESGVAYSAYFEGFEKEILETKCENLRLSDIGYGGIRVDGFPNIKVVCGRETCTCLKKLKADYKKNDPIAKAERERVQKKNQIFKAGTQILVDAMAEHDQGAWLLVLRKVDYNWRDKGEELSIEQIWRKIAHKVLKEDFWGDAPSPAQAHVTRRLESVGLGVENEERSDVEDILLRWERIQGWMKTLVKEVPAIEAVQGNLDNLDKLGREARKFNQVDEDEASKLDILYENDELSRAIARLQELEILMHSPEWSEDGFEDVSWLVTVPADDVNFKANLKRAPAHVLAYALTLVSGTDGNGKRAGVIRGRLNAITREVPV